MRDALSARVRNFMNQARRRLPPPSWLRSLVFHYPFRTTGTLLLLVGLALLGRGLAVGNPYGVALGVLALAVLALLAVASKLQALRLQTHSFHWDTAAPLYARRPDASHLLLAEGLRSWPMLRVHFRLRGTLRVGRGARLLVRREIAFSAAGAHPVPMALPLSGVLDCRGSLQAGDVFALTRARFGEELRRIVPVLPAAFPAHPLAHIEPATGLEEQSRPRSSDEDKYYMREYLPGDRFRDINWKVSGRLAELITRISPITQERTTILPVHFRNLKASARRRAQGEVDGLQAVAHLNVLKSWLLAFLRTVKQAHPQMQFRLVTAESTRILESAEDIERFAGELAGLFYQREVGGNLIEPPESAGELFVFSTPYDRGLGHFLAAQAGARICLFRTRRAGARARGPAADPSMGGGHPRRPGLGPAADPSMGGGHPRHPRLGPAAGPTKSEPLRLLQPGTGCLPGLWVLRRDEPPAATRRSSLGGAGGLSRLEEEPLEVRLL